VDEHYNVYVIDFGVSRIDVDDPLEKMTVIGTPTWMAPEVMTKLPYTNKADTYSFALVLWELATGKPPLKTVPPLSLSNVVVNQKYREKIPPDVDPTLTDLIRRSWDHDPNARPDFKEILDKLWEIKDAKTGRYYCRVHEALSAEIFTNIFEWLPARDVAAWGVTSKYYFNMVKVMRAKKGGKVSGDGLNSKAKGKETKQDDNAGGNITKKQKAKSKKKKKEKE